MFHSEPMLNRLPDNLKPSGLFIYFKVSEVRLPVESGYEVPHSPN